VAIARVTVGTAFATVVGGYVMRGLITPSGPEDPKEAAAFTRTHGRPHSMNIGNHSIELNHMGVVGKIMGLGADFVEVARAIADGDTKEHIAGLIISSFHHNIIDEGPFRSISDALNALDDGYGNKGEKFLDNLAVGMVPYASAVNQLDQWQDPYAREAHGLMQSIMARIPVLSQTLPQRLDIWGKPVPTRGWMHDVSTASQDDPVDVALYKLGYFPAYASKKIDHVDLSDEEHHLYVQLSGTLMHASLSQLVQMPFFNGLSTGRRLALVRKRVTIARHQAEMVVKAKYQHIIRDAHNAKMAGFGPSTADIVRDPDADEETP
jgi:hypothetical protein